MTRKTTAYARRRATRRADGISTLRVFGTRLSAAERERILTPCRRALDALRTATATYHQWVVLCTATHVVIAIEDGGVMTGQREIADDAEQALNAICARNGKTAEAWAPAACRGPELQALHDLVSAHSRQLHELTYHEYVTATQLAERRVASDGGKVFRIEATPHAAAFAA